MRRFLLLPLLVVFLAACSSNKTTYKFYVTHPNVAIKKYKSCQAADEVNDPCAHAASAVRRLVTLQRELVAGPQEFGKKVLAAQDELVTLKTAYQKTPNNTKAKAAYEKQLVLVNTYLAVCKISGE